MSLSAKNKYMRHLSLQKHTLPIKTALIVTYTTPYVSHSAFHNTVKNSNRTERTLIIVTLCKKLTVHCCI